MTSRQTPQLLVEETDPLRAGPAPAAFSAVEPKVFSKERAAESAQTELRSAATAETRNAPSAAVASERQSVVSARAEPARQAPLPKRPKGRLLIAGAMLLCLGAVGFLIWDSFYRFQAFGTVTGRVVEVPPPWAGTVEALYVQEGEEVDQGDVLATLKNPEIDDKIGRLTDELSVARADLGAEVARLALEAQVKDDRQQQAFADYYELAGELLAAQATLDVLSSKLTRFKELDAKNAVSRQDFDSARFAEAGQRAKVERLQLAVAELRKRVEAVRRPIDDEKRLKPKLAQIDLIQSEIRRLRERLQRGTIRAPVAGRVIALRHDVGEYAQPSESVVALLRQGSLELLVYVRQSDSPQFAVGKVVGVIVDPHDRLLRCLVARRGEEYAAAPESVETRFRHGERLLPVYLTPPASARGDLKLTPGSEVRVPHTWHSLVRNPF